VISGYAYRSSCQAQLYLGEISASRNRFPRLEFLAERFELGRCTFVSVVAQEQMMRWVKRCDRSIMALAARTGSPGCLPESARISLRHTPAVAA